MFKISARAILELGAELISSDIIAFYELIKNSLDAQSKTGVEIYFNITLQKNGYLSLLSIIDNIENEHKKKKELLGVKEMELIENQSLENTKKLALSKLEPSSFIDDKDEFEKLIKNSENLRDLSKKITEGYLLFNTIEIIDSGSGMSADDLVKNYLTIGTASRKKEVDAAHRDGVSKSPYLGEKGIGRLSVMRLGEYLKIETSTSKDECINLLEINWALFQDLDALVEDIDVKPAAKPKEQPWNGTKLIISNISSSWSESSVKSLCEYDFAKIIDYFSDQKNRPRIAVFWNRNRIAIPGLNSLLLENSHAKFNGRYEIVDDKPRLVVNMEAINLGFDHPRKSEVFTYNLPDLEALILGVEESAPLSALTDVGEFSFEAFWYNRRRLTGIDTIGNQKAVRTLLEKWSGILLFRDGFRVFPYGEDKDDWLGLDRKALGRPGYVLNKTQFVGRVNISRFGNPHLVDQTNREGLRSTSEQFVFITLLQFVIRDALFNFFKSVEFEFKKQSVDLSESKVEIERLETRAKSALSKVRKLVPSEEAHLIDDLQHAFNEFQDFSRMAKQRIAEVEEDSLQMIHMAGIGLMVEVVAHELARAVESALNSVESLRGKDMPSEFKAKLETLKSEMKTVSKRLRILDQLSVSGRQRSEIFDLGELFSEIAEGHTSQFKRHDIEFVVDQISPPIKLKLVKGMLIQIIENLLSNSIYWTGIRKKAEPWYKPKIFVRVLRNPLTIVFSDNGRGISVENQERVFKPFWSLKDKGKRRGLGLYIARENAQYMDGSLYLASDVNRDTGRLHDFVLELPDMVLLK